MLERLPVTDFLAVRFVLATLVLVAVSPRAVRVLDRVAWRRGVVAGAVYGVAQVMQTTGLAHAPASVSGFITGLYVVATPVLAAAVFGLRVRPAVWLAVVMSTVGLGVLSLRGLHVGFGELITLVSALTYAVHIVLLSRWSRPGQAYAMATVQTGVIAVICVVCALPHGIALPSRGSDWVAVVYMAVGAGAVAMLAQTWAQGHLSAPRAALLMTMEPVFAATFAVLFGGEHLTVRIVVGGLLVLAAMVVAEREDVPHALESETDAPLRLE